MQADPGLKKTVTLDLDLKKMNGQSLPAQIVHSVTSMRDGAPGESRSIVLTRQKSGESDQSASAAGCGSPASSTTRRWRLPPVDGEGRILRTNAPFLKLFSGIVSRNDVENGALLEVIVQDGDKSKLQQALAAAKDRQGRYPSDRPRTPTDEARHFRFYVNAVIDQTMRRRKRPRSSMPSR